MREILVGDSPADAIKRHQPFVDEVYRVQYKPERSASASSTRTTGERKPLTSDDPYFHVEEFMQERWLLGTPTRSRRRSTPGSRASASITSSSHPARPACRCARRSTRSRRSPRA
jgi:hypothetical protein